MTTTIVDISGSGGVGVDTAILRRAARDFDYAAQQLQQAASRLRNCYRQAGISIAHYPQAAGEISAYATQVRTLVNAYLVVLQGDVSRFAGSLRRAADHYDGVEVDYRQRFASLVFNLAMVTSPVGWSALNPRVRTAMLHTMTAPATLVATAVDRLQRNSSWKVFALDNNGECLYRRLDPNAPSWTRWLHPFDPARIAMCSPLGTTPKSTATPVHAADLVTQLKMPAPSGNKERIRILEHRVPQPSGGYATSYSVIIKGTQRWDMHSNHPQDMGSNLQAYHGWDSDAQRAVIAALESADIPAHAPIELVGHSQGGIIVGQLAASPQFNKKYHVVSALTTGAPIAIYNPQVNTLSLEHTTDIVPGLDLRANQPTANHTTVRARLPKTVVKTPLASHSLDFYEQTATQAEQSGDLSVQQWAMKRHQAMGLDTKGVHTTARDYVIVKSKD